jgi:hypothetical protein
MCIYMAVLVVVGKGIAMTADRALPRLLADMGVSF